MQSYWDYAEAVNAHLYTENSAESDSNEYLKPDDKQQHSVHHAGRVITWVD